MSNYDFAINKPEEVKIPDCLKRRLEVGNQEQIDALNKYDLEVAKVEEFKQKIKDGTIKKYRVTVEYSGESEFEVYAESEDEAEEYIETGHCNRLHIDKTDIQEIT